MLYVDGEGVTPGSIFPVDLTAFGIANLDPLSGALPGVGYLAVYCNGLVNLYSVGDAIGTSTTMYLGAFSSLPVTDNQGNLLQPGHSCFLTTDNNTYVFTSEGVWRVAGQVYPASVRIYKFTVTVGGSIISGTDDLGNVLTFDTALGDAVSLYLNGSRQVGGVDFILHTDQTITFGVPLLAGNIVEIQVLGHPETNYSTAPTVINTSLWIQDGVTKSFQTQSVGGVLVVPGSVASCMVSKNNVILNPRTDFTVAGNIITFTTAPIVTDKLWMVVGLPAGPSTDVLEAFRRQVEVVANKTYVLDLKAPVPYRITSFVRRVMTSGSCTAKIQIDGVDVVGLAAMNCGVTEVEAFAASANNVAVGQTVTMIITGNAAALDLCICLNYVV